MFEVLTEVFEVAITVAGVLVLLCYALALVEGLLEIVAELRARRRGPPQTFEYAPRPILRPRPRLTLMVRHDKRHGQLRASVQLRGSAAGAAGSIRLELKDGDERLRLSVGRPFPAEAAGRELPFPPFAPPSGASLEEALGWHWDVVLEVGGEEPFRWREHPSRIDGVNAEGELECLVG